MYIYIYNTHIRIIIYNIQNIYALTCKGANIFSSDIFNILTKNKDKIQSHY